MPLYPEVHDILSRVFVLNPAERINVKDLKAAIQNVKCFGIPTARLTEYYNYQYAAWRAAIVPVLPRQLILAPTHQDVGQVKTRLLSSVRNNKRVPLDFKNIRAPPPVLAHPSKTNIHRDPKIPSPSAIRLNPSTLQSSLSSLCVS